MRNTPRPRTRSLAGHTFEESSKPLLLTLGVGVFAGALDLGVLAPALPAIGSEFSVATGDLSWIYTLYLLATVVSIAIMSTLADRYGRRPVYVGCVALFALGSVFAIIAQDYRFFLAARALQALGAGGIFPVATATIGDRVSPERRGSALGLIGATWGLAAIVGPVFGGTITHFISWRWIFALNIPLAAYVMFMATRYVPTTAPHKRGPLDAFGLTLLAGGLLTLIYGITNMHAITIVLGVLFLIGFATWERAAQNPVVPLSLFANSQIAKTYILEIVIGVLEGSLFFIPTVLIGAQHLSFIAAGCIAALGAVAFVAVIPVAGRWLDKVGSRDVLLAGTFFTELGLAIFALGFQSLWLSILSMLVAGIGFGALLGAPTRYIITNETSPGTRAMAIGLLSQMLIIGQILGGALAGGIMSNALSDIGSYRTTYLVFCGVALVALAITATLRSRRYETLETAAA
ncbi:MAG: MFS transporter [Candidatus Eremiobacteraeota bacterium]|nr:MFS transporter [Candidatus Eremiobacteraeota bacterium]